MAIEISYLLNITKINMIDKILFPIKIEHKLKVLIGIKTRFKSNKKCLIWDFTVFNTQIKFNKVLFLTKLITCLVILKIKKNVMYFFMVMLV